MLDTVISMMTSALSSNVYALVESGVRLTVVPTQHVKVERVISEATGGRVEVPERAKMLSSCDGGIHGIICDAGSLSDAALQ